MDYNVTYNLKALELLFRKVYNITNKKIYLHNLLFYKVKRKKILYDII